MVVGVGAGVAGVVEGVKEETVSWAAVVAGMKEDPTA